jgi:succinoglycan biosynthesis transport protein ExoP
LHETSPTLRQYLRFLQRQAWLILLIPAIAIGSSAWALSRQDSVYRASMGIIVAQGGGQTQPQIGNRPLTQTMTNILQSDVIAQRVVDDLNLPITSTTLLKKLHVSVKPDSSILTVTYDSTDKRRAVAVLSSVGRSYLTLIREKLGVSGSLRRPGPLLILADIFDPPHLESDRVSPKPAKTLAFAGALGLALGLILGFARESLDDRVRSRRDAEEWFGAPVIGTLPKGLRGRPPVRAGDERRGRNKGAEALDVLRANFQFAASGPAGPTLVVTSALENEGKTTVVASLGIALAKAGRQVIAVETDLRRPNLHRLLGAPEPRWGLQDVIEGRVGLSDALQEIRLVGASGNGTGGDGAGPSDSSNRPEAGSGRLRLLPAGAATLDPRAGLSAERVLGLANDLKELASYVIFDSPALLSAGAAVPLAVSVDNVVVVARQGYTTRDGAEEVRAMLEGLGARKVAVVLIDARERLGATTD